MEVMSKILNVLQARMSFSRQSCGTLNRRHKHSRRAQERQCDFTARQMYINRETSKSCDTGHPCCCRKRSTSTFSCQFLLGRRSEWVTCQDRGCRKPAHHFHNVILSCIKLKYLGTGVYDHDTSRVRAAGSAKLCAWPWIRQGLAPNHSAFSTK